MEPNEMVSLNDFCHSSEILTCVFSLAHFYFVTHSSMDDGDGEKTQYCRVDEENVPPPKAVFGLPCHDECADGTYATVRPFTKEISCEQCPANTYSIGSGGIRIDGTMGAFGFHGEDGNVMPLRMEASC